MRGRGRRILLADHRTIHRVDPASGEVHPTEALEARPTSVAWDPWVPGRAWAGTRDAGAWRSDDGGERWRPAGLDGRRVMVVAPSPAAEELIWAGTEPSAVWVSEDGGGSWRERTGLDRLGSSSEWSFPPRPETHHVRWIGCHPDDPGRLWVAIEAGALVSTHDGGRTWRDRVPDGPRDTHELAVHPDRPDTLRVAAGDGYYESDDGGGSWAAPRAGLDVGYLRSVAIDPGDADTVVVSAASHAHAAYVAGRSDGRIYRRTGAAAWARVTAGWPDPPDTIAPLLTPGAAPGELWAADERGVHRSEDGGRSWERAASFARTPEHLRGLAVRHVNLSP